MTTPKVFKNYDDEYGIGNNLLTDEDYDDLDFGDIDEETWESYESWCIENE